MREKIYDELADNIRGIITKNSISIKAPKGKYLSHIHEIDFEATVTDLLHYLRSK